MSLSTTQMTDIPRVWGVTQDIETSLRDFDQKFSGRGPAQTAWPATRPKDDPYIAIAAAQSSPLSSEESRRRTTSSARATGR